MDAKREDRNHISEAIVALLEQCENIKKVNQGRTPSCEASWDSRSNATMSAYAKRPAAAPFPSTTLDCLRSLLSGSCSS